MTGAGVFTCNATWQKVTVLVARTAQNNECSTGGGMLRPCRCSSPFTRCRAVAVLLPNCRSDGDSSGSESGSDSVTTFIVQYAMSLRRSAAQAAPLEGSCLLPASSSCLHAPSSARPSLSITCGSQMLCGCNG